MTDWKRKLAAYLHDPPEKAYDFGPAHKQRAEVHSQNFGVGELWSALGGNPDWAAAAADRFVFPHGSLVGGLGEDKRLGFVHPVSGRSDDGRPSLPTDGLAFPTHADAQESVGAVSPDWRSKDPQVLFLLAWRQWCDCAASQGAGTELLPYLPADTRCPDGTIWHHCAMVSALETCRESGDLKLPPKPAFLLFQVGPVQDFIAQARSTRDLWSGSYLLSWLMMHAIKAVADVCGPDVVIFPSLRGQPLYDFLECHRLGIKVSETAALVPGIPNRFLAIVPAGFDAAIAEKAFLEEWHRIAKACREWLVSESKGQIPFAEPFDTLFNEQVKRHWHTTWQLLPWASADAAMEAFARLPLGQSNPLHLSRIIAESIPAAHRDKRCYRGGQLDPGWAWSAHYQLCQHALDARRSLRDFPGSRLEPKRKPGERDALSGREEAVVQADAIEKLTAPALRALFRHTDPLGAANLIKRVWHKAYLARLDELEKERETRLHPRSLPRAREAFESVPAVAAGAFANRLYSATAQTGLLREKWQRFHTNASAARDDFPDSIADFMHTDEAEWLKNTDHSVFFQEVWQKEAERKTRAGDRFYHAPDARQRLSDAGSALRDLLAEAKAEPSRYYAVLALDGDQIGRWLSGEKSPAVGRILTPKAREYFEHKMLPVMTPNEKEEFVLALAGLKENKPERPGDWQGHWPPQSPEDWIRLWLACPRPLSPSWHLQFSEALANFGIHAARRIVEDVHHGQLIYSGGDDVLAMLPADEAITCATDLRAAFQGRHADMSPACQSRFKSESPEGFLRLKEPCDLDPRWPLLVPGPRMTVSVGLAIGHVKEPMQDMIQEAQRAEKRAKADPERRVFDWSDPDPEKHGEKWIPGGWGRDALAVTLFKRSGETLQWGARFGSAAFGLLDLLRRHYRAPWGKPDARTPITGRFPHRLAELLAPYGALTPISGVKDVVLREVEFVIKRQTLSDEDAPKMPVEPGATPFRRDDFLKNCAGYLEELAAFSWNRPDEEARTNAARPLQDFINLFLLEAFIRRQAD